AVVVAAASVIVPLDGPHLGVDVIRIARSNSNVDTSELVRRTATDSGPTRYGIVARNAAASIHACTRRVRAAGYLSAKYKAVIVPGNRGKISWATADWHRAAVNAVCSVLTKVILHECGEAAGAYRRNDAGNAGAHVC